MNISIIIPTLNEEATLAPLLANLLAGPRPGPEIIVADGGSTDHTLELARRPGVLSVSSRPGRGPQQNRGARAASRDNLLFLHCDTRLPEAFAVHVHAILERPQTAAGAFRLKINGPGAGLRLVEWGVGLRSRLLQMVYGDQAIFVRREVFHQAGGFADQAILEDLDLIRRLRRLGRIRVAPAAVTTSARRWQRLGIIRTTLLNQVMLAGYLARVKPEKLARLYYGGSEVSRAGKPGQSG
ncbi:beta-monoglucosyldiacylglycerol synthase [bacterium BMS3Bbin14]|nr:beta-monoglucosyldiacylglycerol synthase [bacterium BMS3Abin13]GBE52586.1 beta-monoglucosyldiacylglycerol synthase [bacterium BMS3Bbin14]